MEHRQRIEWYKDATRPIYYIVYKQPNWQWTDHHQAVNSLYQEIGNSKEGCYIISDLTPSRDYIPALSVFLNGKETISHLPSQIQGWYMVSAIPCVIKFIKIFIRSFANLSTAQFKHHLTLEEAQHEFFKIIDAADAFKLPQ